MKSPRATPTRGGVVEVEKIPYGRFWVEKGWSVVAEGTEGEDW